MKPIATFLPTSPKSAGTQHPPNHLVMAIEVKRMRQLGTPKAENSRAIFMMPVILEDRYSEYASSMV